MENSGAWRSRGTHLQGARELQSPKNMLIFSSKGETGKIKLSTRTVKVFVANDKILDDGLRGKEGASVPNNMFYTALVSPLLFMLPGIPTR